MENYGLYIPNYYIIDLLLSTIIFLLFSIFFSLTLLPYFQILVYYVNTFVYISFSIDYAAAKNLLTIVSVPYAGYSVIQQNLRKAGDMMMDILRQQRGSTMVIAAGTMMVLLILTAAVLGFGNLYANTTQLQGLVDAASLAGAQGLRSDTSQYGGDDPWTVAKKYAMNNAKINDTGDIKIGTTVKTTWTAPVHATNWVDWSNVFASIFEMDWVNTATACNAPTNTINTITVTATRTVDFPLPEILGIDSKTITASSTSSLIAASSVHGSLRPWGMWRSSLPADLNLLNRSIYQNINGIPGIYIAEYTIRVNGTPDANNKFIPLDLLTKGDYTANIAKGYTGTVTIGDTPTTDSDDMGNGGTTAISNFLIGTNYDIDRVDPRRVIGIPIIDDTSHKVVGFAAFLLHQVRGNSVTANILQVVMADGIIYGYAPTSSGITKAVITK